MKVIIQKNINFDENVDVPTFVPYKNNNTYLKDLLGESLYTDLGNIPSENLENNAQVNPEIVHIKSQNTLKPYIYLPLSENIDSKKLMVSGKKVIELMHKFHYKRLYYIPLEDVLEISQIDYTRKFIEGIFYGLYTFHKYKKEGKERKLAKLYTITENKHIIDFFDNEFSEIKTQFKYLNIARDLTNEPSNMITPESFSVFVKNNTHKNINLNIWDENIIDREKLNLIMAVGKGSHNKPRFIIMKYMGDNDKAKHICLIGKGVTFDTGGTNLKPTGSIETMKSDMAGAAISYAIINFVAEMNLKMNLVVLLPLVENIIGTNSYKPGDIYTSYSGKSVEILNTDAEGRLILADSLSYGAKNGAKVIIDIATLTGAIVVTFGSLCAGYFTNSETLSEAFIKSTLKTKEDFFRLPLIEEYRERIKSKNADLQNVANQRREAGSIIAALFLEEFVNKKPWLHLDVAGPAFLEEEHPLYGAGGSSYGFRSLYELIKSIYDSNIEK